MAKPSKKQIAHAHSSIGRIRAATTILETVDNLDRYGAATLAAVEEAIKFLDEAIARIESSETLRT